MSEISAENQAPHYDPATYTAATLDGLHVKRVFGEAYETSAGTVIPVAKIVGGTSGLGGYGTGHGTNPATDSRSGSGSGSWGVGTLGLRVKPLGAYTVQGSEIRWSPALDCNRIALFAIAGVTVLAVAAVAGNALIKRKRGLLF